MRPQPTGRLAARFCPSHSRSTSATLDEAVEVAGLAGERVFIFGGGDVYAQAMDRADQLELTHVHCELDGDVLFPAVDATVWQIAAREARGEYNWVSYRRL